MTTPAERLAAIAARADAATPVYDDEGRFLALATGVVDGHYIGTDGSRCADCHAGCSVEQPCFCCDPWDGAHERALFAFAQAVLALCDEVPNDDTAHILDDLRRLADEHLGGA